MTKDLVGDELNQILTATLIPDFQKSLTDKVYLDYIKQNEYLKNIEGNIKKKLQSKKGNYTKITKNIKKRGKNNLLNII